MENAIEISYRALEENPDKRVFLLSQMIHNQEVNNDLKQRGIQFIMDTDGTQFIPWNEVRKEDVVIIPAFGTTLEIEQQLTDLGVEVQQYNTTCPFVEKVWNRSEKLASSDYTIIIHGKPRHEETRATFSHSARHGAAVIVQDLEEARRLGAYVLGVKSKGEFYEEFALRHTDDFDPERDLRRVGVVNQTTMLASETQTIADYFRGLMNQRYGSGNIKEHFSDTRDTLCYATNDNQEATYQLLETQADIAVVVGGYNSSNTSHIVELCERKFKTFFIDSEKEIKAANEIHHFDLRRKKRVRSDDFIPDTTPARIVITSGASCPDTLVDRVLLKILSHFQNIKAVGDLLEEMEGSVKPD